MIYASRFDTNSLEWEKWKNVGDAVEGATYNEDGWENIYAESATSQEHADKQVYRMAVTLRDKFAACIHKMDWS
jgi:phage terminase large subunit-like protein